MWAATRQNQRSECAPNIRQVWSESLLSAWRNLGSLATHWAQSEDSGQFGRMPRLIWVFAGSTLISLVLSCHGSCIYILLTRWHFVVLIYFTQYNFIVSSSEGVVVHRYRVQVHVGVRSRGLVRAGAVIVPDRTVWNRSSRKWRPSYKTSTNSQPHNHLIVHSLESGPRGNHTTISSFTVLKAAREVKARLHIHGSDHGSLRFDESWWNVVIRDSTVVALSTNPSWFVVVRDEPCWSGNDHGSFKLFKTSVAPLRFMWAWFKPYCNRDATVDIHSSTVSMSVGIRGDP